MVFMARTNLDIDAELLDRVMRRYRVTTKREAVDLALRRVAGETLSRGEILELEGAGWDGDLDDLRRDRTLEPGWPSS